MDVENTVSNSVANIGYRCVVNIGKRVTEFVHQYSVTNLFIT